MNPLALSLLVPALISGGIAVYAFKRRPVLGSHVFAFLMLALCVWSISYGAELTCRSLQCMMTCAALEYTGIATVPVLLLILTMLYSGRERWATRKNVILLFIIPFITIIMVATNQLHYWHYSTTGVDNTGGYTMLMLTRGPWFWVHIAYSYGALLISMVFLGERLGKKGIRFKKQVTAMLIGTAIPWTMSILYVGFGLMPFGHLDLTPFAFTGTGIIIAWSIYSQKLFDLMPTDYDSLVDCIDDVMVVLDMQNRIVEFNRAAYEILHLSQNDIGETADEIWEEHAELLRLSRSGEKSHMEIAFDLPDAKHYWDASVNLITERNSHVQRKVILLHDITGRKQMEQKLEERATHDFLTGLPNRALLMDRFAVAVAQAQRNKTRLAVMVLDLDEFKSVNDKYGHSVGDRMLKAVSRRLTRMTRASDTLARVGGDEFILLIPEINQESDAENIALKLQDLFKEPFLIDDYQLKLSISIGIAVYPDDGQDLATLLNKSDAAMYYSKEQGQNQFKFFSDGDV